MKILGLDLETTGLDAADGHRVIEIACLTYDSTTRKLVDRYVQRIDPERPITPKAQEVHGISYNELVGQPKWDSVAPEVHKRLAAADMMVAHNAAFDVPFVEAELIRVGLPLPIRETFCTMENGRFASFDGKYPRLQELCFAFGVDYNPKKAHAADYDAVVMMECLWSGITRGVYTLPC